MAHESIPSEQEDIEDDEEEELVLGEEEEDEAPDQPTPDLSNEPADLNDAEVRAVRLPLLEAAIEGLISHPGADQQRADELIYEYTQEVDRIRLLNQIAAKEATTEALKNGKPDPNAPAPTTKKYSEVMKEKGIDPSLGVVQELADMMRAAAKADGDISVASWYRKAWANAVNSANLTHEVEHTDENGVVTKSIEPWIFDLTRLELKGARTSTRNLTPQQKEKLKAKKQEEAKEERTLVAQLLADHKAKLAKAKAAAAS